MAAMVSKLLLFLVNVLIPIAILTFATGFFPYKPFLPGLAHYNEKKYGVSPEAPFDKVIFMVVDALRRCALASQFRKKVTTDVVSDFVYCHGSGFQYTQSLINSGAALPFTAHATSPTITMPRVKAITTGSIPSFLDVILNFAESDTTATLAHQDSWLAQMAKKDGSLLMYGDDTWLKLFPDTFTRTDGTTSFFVSDFTEVDTNVTRHVPNELRTSDWNTMVLHYLGLDHIGHKTGPRSPNMVPKQQEMDEIVELIYRALEKESHLKSTLLVLCGDHGMNDAGNHGGSSPGETSPALLFISPLFKKTFNGTRCPVDSKEDFQYFSTVEQSDIVPTLAGLLGFPIPRNNLGVFIPKFLALWNSERDKEHLAWVNAKQLIEILTETFPHAEFSDTPLLPTCLVPTTDIGILESLWSNAAALKKVEDPSIPLLLDYLNDFSTFAQKVMSSTASNYDIARLQTGFVLICFAFFLSSLLFVNLPNINLGGTGLAAIALAYGAMMFASSYVEEEQNFWYWASSGWLAYLFLQDSFSGLSSLGLLVTLRIVRRWNQTGQKLAGSPNIAKTFLPHHNMVLWVAVIAAYLDLLQRLSRKGFRRAPIQVSIIVALTLILSAVGFKVAFTNADAPELLEGLTQSLLKTSEGVPLVTQARTVFLGLAASFLYTSCFELGYRRSGENPDHTDSISFLHDLLTLFLVTQSRLTNIPLFLLFELQLRILSSTSLSLPHLTTTTLLLSHTSFFALGGSNAISSIDLSNAYNGIAGYNAPAVGLLTFVSNWAGPIWWASATNLLLLRLQERGERDVLLRHWTLLTLWEAVSAAGVMAACFLLRSHLFIWTVFSPKFLYAMAWAIVMHLGVSVFIGGLLFWAGSVRRVD
ncbi:MAG: major facilitator super transporter protein [Trizodia sp. TS-e1964]|nr:MAG: major facilitator super transporter protein [Trizodia sp. TS-e1964]